MLRVHARMVAACLRFVRQLDNGRCNTCSLAERLAAGVSGVADILGDCDNALAESVTGLFKTQLIKPHGLRRTAE